MQHRNLDYRLHQRGRRSGAIIGVSIAAAMLLGIVTFVLLYALVDPLTTEFISKDGAEVNLPAPDPLPTREANDPTAVATTAGAGAGVPTPTVVAEFLSNSAATVEDRGFQPNYQVSASGRINLRSGPGTNSNVVVVLSPGTPLEFLDDSRVADNPEQDGLPPGGRWLRFRTEDGDEGWIREIDVSQKAGTTTWGV
jgi:hypothetical protein